MLVHLLEDFALISRSSHVFVCLSLVGLLFYLNMDHWLGVCPSFFLLVILHPSPSLPFLLSAKQAVDLDQWVCLLIMSVFL